LVEGDIVLLKPGCLHKSIYFEGGPVRRLIIAFSLPQEHGLAYSIRGVLSLFNLENPVIRLSPEKRLELFQMLDEIAAAKRNKEQYSDLYMFSHFCDFLYALKAAAAHNLYENKELGEMAHKINTIASYIHTHYTEPISLEQLSEHFSISDCYLSRKFKEVLGFPLIQYIQMTRVRGAQRLLLTTDQSIQEWRSGAGSRRSPSSTGCLTSTVVSLPERSGRWAGRGRPSCAACAWRMSPRRRLQRLPTADPAENIARYAINHPVSGKTTISLRGEPYYDELVGGMTCTW
jgi:AraC-like DNA-binding protein